MAGITDAKQRVNEIAMPTAEAVAEDSRLFLQGMRSRAGQTRLKALFERGLQTDGDLEAGFGAALAELPHG